MAMHDLIIWLESLEPSLDDSLSREDFNLNYYALCIPIFLPNLRGHVFKIQIEIWTKIQVSTKILIWPKIQIWYVVLILQCFLNYYAICIPIFSIQTCLVMFF